MQSSIGSKIYQIVVVEQSVNLLCLIMPKNCSLYSYWVKLGWVVERIYGGRCWG